MKNKKFKKKNNINLNLDNKFVNYLKYFEKRYPVRFYTIINVILLIIAVLIMKEFILSRLGFLTEPVYDYSFMFNIITYFIIIEIWYIYTFSRRYNFGWRWIYNFKD